MSDVGYALRARLLDDQTISSLVGQRMYPDNLPQNATMPAMVYRRVSTRPEHELSDLTRLAHARIEIDCYASSRAVANSIASAVRTSGIFSYRGVVSGVTFCGTELDSGVSHGEEAPTDGNGVHRFISSFDLNVHYKEAL